MKRDPLSRSVSRLRQSHLTTDSRITQPHFNQFIYINEQTVHKQKATIFHSPYKNGKKNPDYANPTFMSSELFYPRAYVEEAEEPYRPKKAIVNNPSPSPMKRREILGRIQENSRSMKKSRSQIGFNKNGKQLSVSQSKKDLRPSERKNQRNQQKKPQLKTALKDSIVRLIQTSESLQKQLQLLKKNAQNNEFDAYSRKLIDQRKRMKTQHQHLNNHKVSERPVYFQQKKFTDDQIKNKTKQMLVKYLRQSLLQQQTKKTRQNKQKNQEKKLMDDQYQRFKKNLLQTKKIERERANLLNQVLKNQAQR